MLIIFPLNTCPLNGVFLPFDMKLAVLTVHSLFGSNIVISAGAPTCSTASFPKRSPITLAGSVVSLEITRSPSALSLLMSLRLDS